MIQIVVALLSAACGGVKGREEVGNEDLRRSRTAQRFAIGRALGTLFVAFNVNSPFAPDQRIVLRAVETIEHCRQGWRVLDCRPIGSRMQAQDLDFR